MRSMTGFGAGTATADGVTVTVHVAAVNHRGVQVNVRSELRDLALDEVVKNEVRAALQRGTITVQIQVHSNNTLTFDRTRVVAAWHQLASVANEVGAPLPTIDRVVALVGGDTSNHTSSYEPLLRQALQTALQAHQAERSREGNALAEAFQRQTATLRSLLPKMQHSAAARAESYRTTLQTRVAEVLRDVATVTPEHLVREVALYADRIDVTEELVRLTTHVGALERLIVSDDEQLGRKLDFLLQEIGREINTTGAKSNDTTLTGLVLEAKAVVEQMKEQAANLC